MARISKTYVRLAQTILQEEGQSYLRVDGIFGKASRGAVFYETGRKLTSERGIAYIIQREADKVGIGQASNNDAWWGPTTENEAEQLSVLRSLIKKPAARPDEKEECDECRVKQRSGVKCWSPSSRAMIKKYGAVGSNQGTVQCPFPLVLDWDDDSIVDKFSAHESKVDAIERVLERIGNEYEGRLSELGLNRFGGCLNVRKKRGGSTWSSHAWGTAIDWWPAVNRLRESHKSARFAQKQYIKFLDLWEEEGFISLGRCYDFDWMHVQVNP